MIKGLTFVKLNDIYIRAVQSTHGTKEQLVNELQDGNPVSVIKVWENGNAHWVTVVGYDKPTDYVYFIDPYEGHSDRSAVDKVRHQGWSDFASEWGNQATWTKLVYIKNEMILFDFNPLPKTIPHP